MSTEKKTHEQHINRHKLLHKHLDELVADFITESGGLPSKTTVSELIKWSHEQTFNPSDRQEGFLP
jgi:hypothetical protein